MWDRRSYGDEKKKKIPRGASRGGRGPGSRRHRLRLGKPNGGPSAGERGGVEKAREM